MSDFVYSAEAELDDGTIERLDLEERGWADKELLNRVKRWAIVPKGFGDGPVGLPLIVVNIPEGAKPVFKSVVFKSTLGAEFRVYGVGWHKGQSHWTWVHPNGIVEVGERPLLADGVLEQMNAQIRAQMAEAAAT